MHRITSRQQRMSAKEADGCLSAWPVGLDCYRSETGNTILDDSLATGVVAQVASSLQKLESLSARLRAMFCQTTAEKVSQGCYGEEAENTPGCA